MGPLVRKFRKKPVEIEAAFFPGSAEDATPIINWILEHGGTARYHEVEYKDGFKVPDYIAIDTLEGTMQATAGDWVIRGIEGEFYPCKPTIFFNSYDETTYDA